jgi:hypothetical protein
MDPKIDGAFQFCILLDMRNKNIFNRLQEAYREGCVSCVWVYANGPKPFAMVIHHLPITPDQENIQFQMESNASVPKSNASHINMAQLRHETQVYSTLIY